MHLNTQGANAFRITETYIHIHEDEREAVIKREQSSMEQTESIWERGMGVLRFSLKASF